MGSKYDKEMCGCVLGDMCVGSVLGGPGRGGGRLIRILFGSKGGDFGCKCLKRGLYSVID